jgi:hypothetical protein
MATTEEDLAFLIKTGQIKDGKPVEKATPAPNEKDEEK